MTVWTPSYRSAGAVTALGSLLAVVATVPTRWFGPTPADSYVFDPPRFSALWIERTVVPVLAVAAALLFLVGLLALLQRDRARMARWHRWLAGIAVIGAAVGALATILLLPAGGRTADPTAAMNTLLGALLALLAVLLLLPGLVAWGAGHLRAGRRTLGAALAGGPVLSVAAVAVSISLGVDFGPVGALPVVSPIALMLGVVGWDLWVGGATE